MVYQRVPYSPLPPWIWGVVQFPHPQIAAGPSSLCFLSFHSYLHLCIPTSCSPTVPYHRPFRHTLSCWGLRPLLSVIHPICWLPPGLSLLSIPSHYSKFFTDFFGIGLSMVIPCLWWRCAVFIIITLSAAIWQVPMRFLDIIPISCHLFLPNMLIILQTPSGGSIPCVILGGTSPWLSFISLCMCAVLRQWLHEHPVIILCYLYWGHYEWPFPLSIQIIH